MEVSQGLTLQNRLKVVFPSASSFSTNAAYKDANDSFSAFDLPQSHARHVAAMHPSRVEIPLDLQSTFSEMPKLHLLSSQHEDGKNTVQEVPLPFVVFSSLSLHPKMESRFSLALNDDADQQRNETKRKKNDTNFAVDSNVSHTFPEADASNLRALLKIAHRMELKIPLLPLFMTHCRDQAINNDIHFCCIRQGDLSSTSCGVSFPFQEAITAEYVFQHCESRVYCLVKLKNLLNQTSLWMRGVTLRVLDPRRTYRVRRVSEVYHDFITREWKPQEARQLLFELALHTDFVAMGMALHHSVQVEIFYSNWHKTYVSTCEEDRVVLHLTNPHGGPFSHDNGSRMNPTGIQSFQEKPSDSNQSRSGASMAIKLSDTMFTRATQDSSSLPLRQDVLPPIRWSDSSQNQARDTEVLYDPDELAYLSSSCNVYYGPPASFRSTYFCLFTAIIQAESNWETQDGMTVDGTHHVMGMTNEQKDDSTLKQTHEFVLVAGEPVRFSVRLSPLLHNWPGGSRAENDFFIELHFDTAQWMVIGKKRTRQTLSATDEVMMYFTALPLLPENPNAGSAPSFRNRSPSMMIPSSTQHSDAVRVAAGGERQMFPESITYQESSTDLVDRIEIEKGIVKIPTIRIFRAKSDEIKGSEVPGCDAAITGKEEVLVDVVHFRCWAKVIKKVR
ncbi:unnamed protein product [Phytomonas sp. Hart1]|nr:unnamed protein product [Phytomonas sp. Hart1]|eukprot:CCW66025.1 unnamed protein product [Phytomonas sp. isolate Hart1]